MAPPFVAKISLLLGLFTAVAAAPQNEGCDCRSICAEVMARKDKEIARLQHELRTLRGYADPANRRLSCARDWRVFSDADVDAFGREGCRDVKNLIIGSDEWTTSMSNMTSLDGLSGLETAENLTIGYTEKLQSLNGLENLTHVEGSVRINGNLQLRSLAGLQGLVGATLVRIYDNDALESLTGLENLKRVDTLRIDYNNQLTSLDGLQGVVGASVVNIYYNGALQSLTGLENLQRVDTLQIITNNQLTSLDGLQGLEVAGDVHIRFNDGLQNLTGLENLTRVAELYIESNDQLTSLDGLQGLRRADERGIVYFGQLTPPDELHRQTGADLDFLQGMRYVGVLGIRYNNQLRSLDALQGLTHAQDVDIIWNPQLESLSGLESLAELGKLTLFELPELRSIAALRGLTRVRAGGISISNCGKLHSLEGLGTIHVTLLDVSRTPLNFLGGPFAMGSSVQVARFTGGSWPRCVSQHERIALLSVVEDVLVSYIPNPGWQPECGTDFGTFRCTKGQPCNFSLAGEESRNTSVFVSPRFVGCGACSENHPQGYVAEGGMVDLGYVLRDEEAGLHSVCRCAGGIGPVAQLFLRGPRQSPVQACSRGHECTFRLEGEALDRSDRVVLVRSCISSDLSSGFAPSLIVNGSYLFHRHSPWLDAPAGRYQVCWRARCTSAVDGPTCPAPEDRYFHVGDVELVGAYLRNYTPVLGEATNFSVPNIGPGVKDGDQMRLRRACNEADEEEAYLLVANSSGLVFDFGRLTEDRVQAGRHHLCWCHGSSGAQCNAAWHFRAYAGVVQIWCPAGQELVAGRCENCPAGKEQPEPGLIPCLECPIGKFSPGGNASCDRCPSGEVARLKGRSACVACRPWQSTDAEAAGCTPDPMMIVLLTLLGLLLGAIPAVVVHSIRKQLSVVDVSLVENQTIVTTFSPHGLNNFGRPSFPVKFHGTGHPGLDSPSQPFRARVRDAVHLELLRSADMSTAERLDTSMGTLMVDFPHDVAHEGLVAVGLPLLFTAAVALGGPALYAGLLAESLVLGTAVALTCTAAVAALRCRPRATPLNVRLSEFKLAKLGRRLRRSGQIKKGPNRAIALGKMLELLEFFHDFIQDRSAYYLDSNILKQLTRKERVSYAELVGAGTVEWFVSHYWGTPYVHFCTALQKHAETVCGQRDWRSLNYWVCFCSNNQYQIHDELGGEAGWVESSFYLTLQSGWCRGTCMVLDDKALPLTRIWCIFELLQTVKLERNEETFQGLLLCTSGGVLNTGGGSAEVAMALGDKVAGMDLATAESTSASDAGMIRAEVIRDMGSFDELNRFICGEMHAMLVRAQQSANQHFVAVLARLGQTVTNNSRESL